MKVVLWLEHLTCHGFDSHRVVRFFSLFHPRGKRIYIIIFLRFSFLLLLFLSWVRHCLKTHNIVQLIRTNRNPATASRISVSHVSYLLIMANWTNLLNTVFQSTIWQSGVSSSYSCGEMQHFARLISSMPSGEEPTLVSLHRPVK